MSDAPKLTEAEIDARVAYSRVAIDDSCPYRHDLVIVALAAECDELRGLLREGRDVVERLNEAEPGESDPEANKWLRRLSMIPAINLPGVDFPFPTGDSDDAAGGGK